MLSVAPEFASQVGRLARRQLPGWRMTRFRIQESEIVMATDRVLYQAFMLRLWQDQDEAGPVWRASLESPHTGERHGFADLEALFDFLMQCVEQKTHSSPNGLQTWKS